MKSRPLIKLIMKKRLSCLFYFPLEIPKSCLLPRVICTIIPVYISQEIPMIICMRYFLRWLNQRKKTNQAGEGGTAFLYRPALMIIFPGRVGGVAFPGGYL